MVAEMDEAGEKIERTRGTPQGGVVRPILSNTFGQTTFYSGLLPKGRIFSYIGNSVCPVCLSDGRLVVQSHRPTLPGSWTPHLPHARML